jgi:serine O-acetyltransferase
VVGIPARQVGRGAGAPPADAFLPYGTPCGDIPDPIARALNGLLDEVTTLRARVTELEGRGAEPEPELAIADGKGNGKAVVP